MGHIAVHEFTTLDLVIEEPTWAFGLPFDPRMGEALAAVTGGCSGILLGRRTYEMFAPAWSSRTVEDDPGAPFFNDTPKYVVSSTLTDPGWGPATVVGPYRAEAIRELKQKTDGGLYVSGSGMLVRALLADGLVDELHLFVFPLALGSGRQLFPHDGRETRLRLIGAESYDSGVVHLTYGSDNR
jgi:dihydrofolate reductase